MKQLFTKWADETEPNSVLPEYPRPQMKRKSFFNLNGYWNCAFTALENDMLPEKYDQKILVPFSPEAALSGVNRQLQPDEILWYERSFPEELIFEWKSAPAGSRLLIHFGAVDQICTVYVNQQKAVDHTGGYLPFTVDATDYLSIHDPFAGPASSSPSLIVKVRDTSDTSCHTRGKQKLESGGMYYTATSGIWQTVWAEIVPACYIKDIYIAPDLDQKQITLTISSHDGIAKPVNIITDDNRTLAGNSDSPMIISCENDALWTIESPVLHTLRIYMQDDMVESYYAMRSVTIEPDAKGYPRICLNHSPVFLSGVLDQGYWPDGMYTPPSDEAILFDLTEMKHAGYNMVRKHCKIESDRWYYHCDRLGLLVWQDIVNGGDSYDDTYVTILPNLWNWKNTKHKTFDTNKTGRASEDGRSEFREEIRLTALHLRNHPSIIAWTLFNEGWGQFETGSCLAILKETDSTRPVDAASGWYDQNIGDFRSIHNYFFPLRIYAEKDRAFIFSEVGGLPMLIPEHSCCNKIYGYRKKYTSLGEFSADYKKLLHRLHALESKGLCGFVYTQWTDIEDEVNGVYTWDRKVCKII